jgi:photosystem II stability/assembly factor-like uncharacterized protein
MNYLRKLVYAHQTIRRIACIEERLVSKFVVLALIFCFTPLSIPAQWVQLNSGVQNNLHSIDFVSANVGLVVGDSGVILKTLDGQTWSMLNSATTNDLWSITSVTDSLFFACGANGTIVKTEDQGLTWGVVNTNTNVLLREIRFASNGVGLCCGQNGVLLRSQDLGLTWTMDTVQLSTNLFSISIVDSSCIFMCGSGNSESVLKSTDQGLSWTASFQNLNRNIQAMCFVDKDTGYVTTSTFGEVFKTTDGGSNWSNIYSSGFSLYGVTIFDGGEICSVGSNTFGAGGYVTSSGTQQFWASIWDFQYSILWDVVFLNDSAGYVVGNNGQIWYTDNGIANNLNNQFYGNTNFPYSVVIMQDFLSITCETKGITTGWNIFDSAGKMTRSGYSNLDLFEIPLANLPSGLYYVQLISNELNYTIKILR